MLLKQGDVVGKRYRITGKLLGEGGFSEVFPAEDVEAQNAEVAVKIAKDHTSSVLNSERSVLEELQSASYVCRLISHGTHPCSDGKSRRFIAMQRVGKTLFELRKEQEHARFTWATTRALGLHTLNALEQLHDRGYIHRDVKPANFTVGHGAPDAESTFFIIDFGLARKYVDERGAVNPQRSVAQFRGSSKYASVFTHQEQDQGRRDDLWSLLYILVECVDGVLPWAQEGTKRDERDRDEILRKKKAAMEQPSTLTTNVALPVQISNLALYLKTLKFEDKPDYAKMRSILLDGAFGLDLRTIVFDWQNTRAAAPAGEWYEREPAAAAPSQPTSRLLQPKPARESGGAEDQPHAAKRARFAAETASSRELATEMAFSADMGRLSDAGHAALQTVVNLQPHEVFAVFSQSLRSLVASHPKPNFLTRYLDDFAQLAAVQRDRCEARQQTRR